MAEVLAGNATIQRPWRIKKLRNPKPFHEYILRRDNYNCYHCEAPATEVAKLPVHISGERSFASFCKKCIGGGGILRDLKMQWNPSESPPAQEGLKEVKCNRMLSVYCDASVQKNSSKYGIGIVLVDGKQSITSSRVMSIDVIHSPPFGGFCAIIGALNEVKSYLDVSEATYQRVSIYSDVDNIKRILDPQFTASLDELSLQIVQDIQNSLRELCSTFPSTWIDIKFIGRKKGQSYYRLAHRLSREYMKNTTIQNLHPETKMAVVDNITNTGGQDMERKKYPRDFKHKVLKEAAESDNIANIARKHGLTPALVYKWQRLLKNEPDSVEEGLRSQTVRHPQIDTLLSSIKQIEHIIQAVVERVSSSEIINQKTVEEVLEIIQNLEFSKRRELRQVQISEGTTQVFSIRE
ncbi:transposase [Paenibacillus sp. HJGM_3]